jgi:hypothetical protein
MENSAYNGETLTGKAEGNTVGSRESFSKREQSIIVGLLLGDGSMQRLSKKSARLVVKHGVKQREYVYFLYNELRRWVKTPPKMTIELDRRFGIKTNRYRFRTINSPGFLNYYRLFYDDQGKKRLPNNIAQILDDLGLAIWFMDDGSYKNDSKGLLINSNHFSVREQKEIQKVLKNRFKINTTLHTLGQWKRIYIPAAESPKFAKIILPHTIPSLRYKLQKLSLTL